MTCSTMFFNPQFSSLAYFSEYQHFQQMLYCPFSFKSNTFFSKSLLLVFVYILHTVRTVMETLSDFPKQQGHSRFQQMLHKQKVYRVFVGNRCGSGGSSGLKIRCTALRNTLHLSIRYRCQIQGKRQVCVVCDFVLHLPLLSSSGLFLVLRPYVYCACLTFANSTQSSYRCLFL